jgi:hypothetical protein
MAGLVPIGANLVALEKCVDSIIVKCRKRDSAQQFPVISDAIVKP